MGVALEPDFILEMPDVQRDSEPHIAKRKLIPPVSATVHEKRRQAKQLSKPVDFDRVKLHEFVKKKPSSSTFSDIMCKIMTPFFQQIAKIDKFCIGNLTKFLDALYPF